MVFLFCANEVLEICTSFLRGWCGAFAFANLSGSSRLVLRRLDELASQAQSAVDLRLTLESCGGCRRRGFRIVL